jgi:hypothetical protein
MKPGIPDAAGNANPRFINKGFIENAKGYIS